MAPGCLRTPCSDRDEAACFAPQCTWSADDSACSVDGGDGPGGSGIGGIGGDGAEGGDNDACRQVEEADCNQATSPGCIWRPPPESDDTGSNSPGSGTSGLGGSDGGFCATMRCRDVESQSSCRTFGEDNDVGVLYHSGILPLRFLPCPHIATCLLSSWILVRPHHVRITNLQRLIMIVHASISWRNNAFFSRPASGCEDFRTTSILLRD